jgi:hypothetical protein
LRTDERTRQDLIVSVDTAEGAVPLHTNDLGTAQLMALMLDGAGVRRVLDSATSKLVLILGSFAPGDKAVLDRLRASLQTQGLVAVTFDFDRPSARDYAETVLVLAGMSHFVVADFTNAREVRSEVLEVRRQYPRLPVVPIARSGADLPVTLLNSLSVDELDMLVRYEDEQDLEDKLQTSVVEPAERRIEEIAKRLAIMEAKLRNS